MVTTIQRTFTDLKTGRIIPTADQAILDPPPPRKHIILDCDGVLLDWTRGFRNWLYAKTGVMADVKGPATWSLAGWLGMSEQRCFELINEFNASVVFGYLDAVDGAREAIDELKGAGCTFTVLTSCSADPVALQRRTDNLKREFGGTFGRVICLPLRQPKSEWLEALKSGIWVEDNYQNAMMGVAAGHRTFMLRYRHNATDECASDSRVTWASSWRDLISLFN